MKSLVFPQFVDFTANKQAEDILYMRIGSLANNLHV